MQGAHQRGQRARSMHRLVRPIVRGCAERLLRPGMMP